MKSPLVLPKEPKRRLKRWIVWPKSALKCHLSWLNLSIKPNSRKDSTLCKLFSTWNSNLPTNTPRFTLKILMKALETWRRAYRLMKGHAIISMITKSSRNSPLMSKWVKICALKPTFATKWSNLCPRKSWDSLSKEKKCWLPKLILPEKQINSLASLLFLDH